jgi:hypothetical protein
MSTTVRSFPFEARPRLALLALIAMLGLVLAACGGGGNGGGGGGGALILTVAVVNETTDDLAVTLDVGGVAEQEQTLATCKAEVYTFTLPDGEWLLALNGQTVVDSLELETNLVDRNLTAEVQANDDGTVTLTRVQPGSTVQKPAQAGICT